MSEERELPANEHAERTILGAILADGWPDATLMLLEEDFFLSSHQNIFRAILSLMIDGSSVDIVTVADWLEDADALQSIGGRPYLFSLTEGLPRRPAIKDYVKIVRAKSLQRKLIAACEAALNQAYDGASGFDVIEALRGKLDAIEAAARGKR